MKGRCWVACGYGRNQQLHLTAAALLAVLAFADLMAATTLLALTFALGIWVTMNTPTWQAITAELAGNEGRRSSKNAV